jgi:hypothetical protein
MRLGMSELSEILNQIREELRLLYKELAKRLIPFGEPEPDERRAIEEEDELASEDELFQALLINVRRDNYQLSLP